MKLHDFDERFQVIDASWDLPSAARNTYLEHMEKRIPGSRFFCIDECCDKQTSLPHMLPSTSKFQQYMTHLGVSNNHHVIIYDNSPKFGLFSAPRVWWMLRVFGHEAVSVLDGGLPKWISDRFATESGEYNTSTAEENPKFIAKYRPELVRDITFIKENMKSDNGSQIVDARPKGRYQGLDPEPRPDISSGHMPKSLNMPFMDCLKNNREMKSKDELLSTFESNGVDISKDLVASCGSGVSACIVALSAFVCNGKEVPVYDGSWVEWATKEPESIIKS